MKKLLMLLAVVSLIGCDNPHDNAPTQENSFHIPKDGLMGNVGGGGGYTSTHWERFPSNAWMKPCGKDNHADWCYVPDRRPPTVSTSIGWAVFRVHSNLGTVTAQADGTGNNTPFDGGE